MDKLAAELRKRFKSPRDLVRALGLDESLIQKDAPHMSTRELAKKMNAIAVRTTSVMALDRYLRSKMAPKMAMDAKAGAVGYATIFDGVTGAKFKSMIPELTKRIGAAMKGKLAKDATLEDVGKVLTMLDKHEVGGGDESVSKAEHNAMEAAAHGESALGIPEKVGKEFVDKDKGKTTFDADAMRGFLRDQGMADDAIETAMGMMPRPAATDVDPDKEDDKREQEKDLSADEDRDDDEDDKKDAKAKDKAKGKDRKMGKDQEITKVAMDAAIKDAVKAERLKQDGIRSALTLVRPIVGELDMAFDSGDDVLRHALKIKGVDGVDELNTAGLKMALSYQKPAGAQDTPVVHRSGMSMDSASVASFNEMFKDAGRIQTV